MDEALDMDQLPGYGSGTQVTAVHAKYRIEFRGAYFNLQDRSKKWLWTAAAMTAAQTAVSAFVPRGFVGMALTDILCGLVMLCAVAAFLDNGFSSKGRVRLFWMLQAAAWGCWFLDECCWILYDIILRRSIPSLFSGDALLFLAGVPMLAGLLLRPNLYPSKRAARLGILDFALLMCWWMYLYVFFVTCWQYVSPNEEIYNRNFDQLYAGENLVLTAVLALLWFWSTAGWKKMYAVFCAAQLFDLASFYVLNRAIENHQYYNGSWYDVPYTASVGTFVLVALLGYGLTPTREALQEEKYDSWMAALAMIAVLSLPVMAVWSLLDSNIPPEVARFRVLFSIATMALMAFLVFVKQYRLGQELTHTNRVLEDVSMTDPLTGVRNRRFFSATIESDIAQVLRAHADGLDKRTRDVVFYLIDADNFKEINDQFGHDAGDQLLVEMSKRISSAIRHSDVLIRWGGEEFLIVSRYTDRSEAEILAGRVLSAVGDSPYSLKNGTVKIYKTCSIGWATFPWITSNPSAVGYGEILNVADRGLNQAKRAGKNRAVGMLPSRSEIGSADFDLKQPLQIDVLSTVGPKQSPVET